jgi:hypothetical protein
MFLRGAERWRLRFGVDDRSSTNASAAELFDAERMSAAVYSAHAATGKTGWLPHPFGDAHPANTDGGTLAPSDRTPNDEAPVKPARTSGLGIPLPEVMLMSSPTMTIPIRQPDPQSVAGQPATSHGAAPAPRLAARPVRRGPSPTSVDGRPHDGEHALSARGHDREHTDSVGLIYHAQYSLRQILAVWLAAPVPMSILSWGIAPWLSERIGGRDHSSMPS